jgi:ATP-binding cassette subfamily B (MDR/TAP) protein 1
MTTRVRSRLFHKLLHKEIAFYDMEENSTGALTSRLSTDAALVKASLSDRVGLGVMNLTTGVVGLAIAFYRGWKLALVLLALFPVMGLAGVLQFAAMSGFSRADSDAMANSSQLLAESIGGVRTVSSFGIRMNIVNLYKKMLEGPAEIGVRKGVVGGLGFGFSQAVMFWTYGAAFYYGGYLIDIGEYDFNQMFAGELFHN